MDSWNIYGYSVNLDVVSSTLRLMPDTNRNRCSSRHFGTKRSISRIIMIVEYYVFQHLCVFLYITVLNCWEESISWCATTLEPWQQSHFDNITTEIFLCLIFNMKNYFAKRKSIKGLFIVVLYFNYNPTYSIL